MKELLSLLRSFPDQFNESTMFPGGKAASVELRKQFQDKFRNISSVMDCVGCDKCKLWGKLQVTGLGTALKVRAVTPRNLMCHFPERKWCHFPECNVSQFRVGGIFETVSQDTEDTAYSCIFILS